jgi:catechol 2,3-dioxygenase-like lactoylglutathione lyase family enzyme
MNLPLKQPAKLVEIARFVEDVPAMTQFYRQFLGIEPTYGDDTIATFHHCGLTMLIHQRYVPGPDGPPCEDHLAYGVADVDAAVAELVGKGLSISYPPKEYDWGRSAYLRDPAGKLVEITCLVPVNG